MNRLYVGAGALLLVLISAYFFLLKKDPVSTLEIIIPAGDLSTTTEAVASSSAKPEPFSSSLREVLAMGGEYGCHYYTREGDIEVTGTVYVSGNRARGTFIGTFPSDGTMLWYFLLNGGQVRAWFIIPEGAPDGLAGKALLADLDSQEQDEFRNDILEDLNDLYGCVMWELEDDFFTLPRDLTYVNEEGERIYP